MLQHISLSITLNKWVMLSGRRVASSENILRTATLRLGLIIVFLLTVAPCPTSCDWVTEQQGVKLLVSLFFKNVFIYSLITAIGETFVLQTEGRLRINAGSERASQTEEGDGRVHGCPFCSIFLSVTGTTGRSVLPSAGGSPWFHHYKAASNVRRPGDNDGRFKQCRFNCYAAVIPRQIVKRSHSKAGDNGALPLLGQQLLPYTFFGSQWLFHLMRGEKLRGKIFL